MRRGIVILSVVLLVLAGVGIAVGAYHAGESHGVAEQIQQIETTTPDGAEVVRVVAPAYGYGYGWHGGFFPFGILIFPLFIIGTILLVRAIAWRTGPWRSGGGGPGGWGGPGGGWGGPGAGGPPGSHEEFRKRVEGWHRQMHEESGGGDSPGGGDAGAAAPETPPTPA
jgi:hypothetical protein